MPLLTTDTLTPLFSHLFAVAERTLLWILHSHPHQTFHRLLRYFLSNPPQAKRRIKGRKRNGARHKSYLTRPLTTTTKISLQYRSRSVALRSRVQSYKHRTNEKPKQNKAICLLVHLQRVRRFAHTNSRTKSQPVTHTAIVFANHAYTTIYYATMYTNKRQYSVSLRN